MSWGGHHLCYQSLRQSLPGGRAPSPAAAPVLLNCSEPSPPPEAEEGHETMGEGGSVGLLGGKKAGNNLLCFLQPDIRGFCFYVKTQNSSVHCPNGQANHHLHDPMQFLLQQNLGFPGSPRGFPEHCSPRTVRKSRTLKEQTQICWTPR